MKTNSKLIRLVLASTVGSLLWAGCAQPRVAVADFDPSEVRAAPVDQTDRRPDTHPELRSGLWQTLSQTHNWRTSHRTPVVETTVVDNPDIAAPDSTHLLVFNPEVLNVAADPVAAAEGTTVVTTTGDTTIVTEAAGAEPAVTVDRVESAQERWAGGLIERDDY